LASPAIYLAAVLSGLSWYVEHPRVLLAKALSLRWYDMLTAY